MWRDIDRVMRLEPVDFRREFDLIYSHSHDVKTLYQLGGVTNDYLRANPGAMPVPADLPRRLLSLSHVDARVVGLKLLNRSNVSGNEIVREIVRALNRRDGYESCGGLHELGQFLGHRVGSDLDSSWVRELRIALMPLVDDGIDTHKAASCLMDQLNE